MFNFSVDINGLGASDSPYTDEYGVDWVIDPIEGWGAAASTRETTSRTRGIGGWSGNGYSKQRNLTLSGTILAQDAEGASIALDRLNLAASLDTFRLTVYEGSRERYVWAYRSDEVLAKWLGRKSIAWSIGLVCDDPRKFSAQLSASTGLPVVTGGLTVPFTVPFSIDSTVVTGQVSLTNPGNEYGPVMIRIMGPVTGPVITHVNSGRSLVLSSSLSLSEGEFIDIDMERQTVMAQGEASRASYITSRQWSRFERGVNTWAFTAEEFDPDAVMIVYATPADK